MNLTEQTIRVRATLPATIITFVLVVLSLLTVLLAVRQDQINAVRLDRMRSARDLAVAVREGRTLPDPLPVSDDAYLQVIETGTRRVQSASPALAGRPMLPIQLPKSGTLNHTRICPEGLGPNVGCMIAVAITAPEPDGDVTTVVSASPEPALFPGAIVLAGFGGVALLCVGVAATGTWLAVGRSLRPVEAIRAELARITDTDLSRRVPVPRGRGARDEIGRLATTVNATLDRLEHAVTSNQAFVADASHELRSPLAALRSQTEVALLHPERVGRQQALEGILRDVERLQAIVADLLLLARLDSGVPTPGAHTDLTSVVRHESEHHTRRVPIHLDLPGEAVIVAAHELALTRIVVNLVDNAVRHAASSVDIALGVEDGDAVLHVDDDGPGIAREDRERIFERFTRLDEGRARDVGGSGLGLAIARGIATAYKGGLTAGPAPSGGARFTLRLPVR